MHWKGWRRHEASFFGLMMIEKNFVAAAAEKVLEGTGIFLVDVVVSPSNDIEVEVDCEGRMTIDQCSDVNRKLEAAMDRDREDFSLAVYSAGVGYPFKVFRQYLKAVGRMVSVSFPDSRKIEGELLSAAEVDGNTVFSIGYDVKEKIEGEKRPRTVRHEESVTVVPGMSVKEIITIK